MTGPVRVADGNTKAMLTAYVGTLDQSGYVPPSLSLTKVGWMDRTLGALADAAPGWVGDPADRAAALLVAMASAVDDLSDAILDTERVQLALDELVTSCEAAKWLATGEGRR